LNTSELLDVIDKSFNRHCWGWTNAGIKPRTLIIMMMMMMMMMMSMQPSLHRFVYHDDAVSLWWNSDDPAYLANFNQNDWSNWNHWFNWTGWMVEL